VKVIPTVYACEGGQNEGETANHYVGIGLAGAKFICRTVEILGPRYGAARKPRFEGQVLGSGAV